MKLLLNLYLIVLINLCSGSFDYQKYLEENEDVIDIMDPISVLEQKEKALEKKKIIVAEVSEQTGSCPQRWEPDPTLIRPEDCPVVNCTTEEDLESEGEVDGRIYFRRFVSSLMRRLERRLPNDLKERTISFNALISLEQMDVVALRSFLDSKSEAYQDVTEVLSTMVKRVSLADTADMEQLDFDEIFGCNVTLVLKCMGVLAAIAVLTMALSRTRITPKTVISLTVVLFLISVPWDWMHLYKKAVARRVSELATAVPEHCTPVSERSWAAIFRYWALTSFSFADDPCRTYHEAFIVDPILDVSPLEAFTATATKFVVGPLQYVGAGVAKFFNELGKGLPSQYAFFIIVFVMIVFMMWLIMRMGYNIRVPFYGGLERAPERRRLVEATPPLRHGVEDVRNKRIRLPPIVPHQLPVYLPPPGAVNEHWDESAADANNDVGRESSRTPIVLKRIKSAPTISSEEQPCSSSAQSYHNSESLMYTNSYPDSMIVGTRSEVDMDDVDNASLPDSTVDEGDESTWKRWPALNQTGAGDSFEVIPDDENDSDDYDIIRRDDVQRSSSIVVVPVATIESLSSVSAITSYSAEVSQTQTSTSSEYIDALGLSSLSDDADFSLPSPHETSQD